MPATVTTEPPETGPAAGLRALTVGTLSKLKRSDDPLALVPALELVTDTSTVPAGSAGEVAVIVVAEAMV